MSDKIVKALLRSYLHLSKVN